MDSKKITKLSILTLLCSGITSYLTTRFLVKTAMDRELPRGAKIVENRLSGVKANNEFLIKLKEDAEILEQKDLERVEIISYDGLSLVGHWEKVEHPKRVILAMHGWRSSWSKDFGMVTEFWNKQDCNVLYVEQRGQNASGGEYIGFGIAERKDCLEWIHWINNETQCSLPIYLAGVSMGATTVMMAAGLDLPANVHGIMADCGFTSPEEIWKHIIRNNLHITDGIKGFIADEMYQKKTNGEMWNYSTKEALKDSKIPLFLIHGSDDHFVPVQMSYDNYLACSAPKRLLIVPGADHGMSYFLNKEEYEEEALKFWEKYDNRV